MSKDGVTTYQFLEHPDVASNIYGLWFLLQVENHQ
jgi:hypothetical protein